VKAPAARRSLRRPRPEDGKRALNRISLEKQKIAGATTQKMPNGGNRAWGKNTHAKSRKITRERLNTNVEKNSERDLSLRGGCQEN